MFTHKAGAVSVCLFVRGGLHPPFQYNKLIEQPFLIDLIIEQIHSLNVPQNAPFHACFFFYSENTPLPLPHTHRQTHEIYRYIMFADIIVNVKQSSEGRTLHTCQI